MPRALRRPLPRWIPALALLLVTLVALVVVARRPAAAVRPARLRAALHRHDLMAHGVPRWDST